MVENAALSFIFYVCKEISSNSLKCYQQQSDNLDMLRSGDASEGSAVVAQALEGDVSIHSSTICDSVNITVRHLIMAYDTTQGNSLSSMV